MAYYRGTLPPTEVMSSKKEIMGLSTEFFGFGRCWNPPPVSLVGFRRAIARGNLVPALRI